MKLYTVLVFTCCCLFLASGRIFPNRLNPFRFYFNHLKRGPTQITRPFSRFSAISPLYRPSNNGGSVLFNQFPRPGVKFPSTIAESLGAVRFSSNAGPIDRANPFPAKIKGNHELFKTQGLYKASSIIQVELDIEGSNIEYKTGDHVGILLQNDPELVERVGNLLNLDLDKDLSPLSSTPTTYRNFLTNSIELTSIPADKLESLAKYCSDENDRESIIQMATADPSTSVVNLNLMHILETFKSFKPPINEIFKIMPERQPRFYSISSSSNLSPNTLEIVVEQEENLFKTDPSNTLNAQFLPLKNSDEPVQVPIFIQSRETYLPRDRPVIFIGTGTGLAPFRGFIQERDSFRREKQTVGDTFLYVGAQSPSAFLYQDELNEYVQSETLKLRTSITSDEPEGNSVANLLTEDADLVWEAILNNGRIFVSEQHFSQSVLEEIRSALVNVMTTKGRMGEADALQILAKMEEQGRYISDRS